MDDQEDARVLVRTVLSRCGATAVTVGSVAEARAELAKDGFDIVVSDIAMPDEDGFELIRHIRDDLGLNIPVVAMTAFGHPADQDRILAEMNRRLS